MDRQETIHNGRMSMEISGDTDRMETTFLAPLSSTPPSFFNQRQDAAFYREPVSSNRY